MNEEQAKSIADALGGESWQSGGGVWVVVLRRGDGRLVVISDDAVNEYESEDSFDSGLAIQSIHIA